VVPEAVMARFLSLFRVVGTAAGFVFSRYMFGYVETHRKAIFIGAAMIYLVSFMLMCWRVEEGEYPPPDPDFNQPGLIKTIRTYLRECFGIPIYRHYFLVLVLLTISGSVSTFGIFFSRDTIHLSMEDIGKLTGWSYLATLVLYVPAGYLCDRIKPIRLFLLSFILSTAGPVLTYFFVHDWTSSLVLMIVTCPIGVCWATAYQTTLMMLFPKEKFGQYFAAFCVVICGTQIGSNYLAGKFMDYVGDYRLQFIWTAVFWVLALPSMVMLYRGWKRHGGPEHYVPPTASEA
jgi:Na+/melibiose symporter-like transporter